MSAWVKSLDTLANIIAPVNIHLNIQPIGVMKIDEWLYTSWYRGRKKLPDISILDRSKNEFDWPSYRGARPGDRSSWYWRWTFEELRDNLTKIIENKALPICTEIIYKELMWSTTLKILRKGSLYTKSICLNDIKSRLEKEYQNISGINVDKKRVPMSMYKDYIAGLEREGINVVECPIPGGDIENPKDNWVWSVYSDEQLYLRTLKIYHEVIIGYKEIVETFFPVLKNRLRKYVLYPFTLKGDFEATKETEGYSVGPSLNWHLEPLPLDHTDFILDIQMTTKDSDDFYLDDNNVYEIGKKIKEYRPDDCMWLSVTRTGQVLDIFGDTPVTDIIYKWLEVDLKKINWIS